MNQYFSQMAKGRVRVIPNPLQLKTNDDFTPSIPNPFVLAMGRLIPTKCFPKLIHIFAKLTANFPEWHLVIAGEGEERTTLEQQIEALDLTDQIHLIGNTDQPHDWMAAADIFASTSTLEAFPMAICEAMMSGLPVVATAYNDSAREMIPGDAGVVIDHDDAQFSKALTGLMGNPQARAKMGKQGARHVSQFSEANVMNQWQQLFHKLDPSRFEADAEQ